MSSEMFVPGEIITPEGHIEINVGRPTLSLQVTNGGDRPIQVGSHYHFAETNGALQFDRTLARGMRLNIASGTAVRFEPGQSRSVELVAYAGKREVYGFNQAVMGPLDRKAGKGPTAARKNAASKAAKPGAKTLSQTTARTAAKAVTKTAAKTTAKTTAKPAAAPKARKAAGKTATSRSKA